MGGLRTAPRREAAGCIRLEIEEPVATRYNYRGRRRKQSVHPLTFAGGSSCRKQHMWKSISREVRGAR